MGLMQNLSVFAVRQVLTSALDAVGFKAGVGAFDIVVGHLEKHFTDPSQKLTGAFKQANCRAWNSLEVALAGDSWWDRCKALLGAAEERAFRDQVRAFLAAAPLPELSGKNQFRQVCLEELQAARKAGLLTEGSLDPKDLARKVGSFARYGDPVQLLQAENQALEEFGEELRQGGFPSLAWLVVQRPQDGPPLLVCAVRYFFRRKVETDRDLFQGLTFSRLEGLSQAQETGFAALAQALDQHGERLEGLLTDVHALVAETHGDVLNLTNEVQRQGQQLQELGRAVIEALEQNRLPAREVRAGDSLSIRGDEERRLVKMLVMKYRALPENQRQQTPALLNALGKLQVAAGDLEEAQRDFQEVATLVSDPRARAEAQFNTYQTALEQKLWAPALDALRSAVQLDPARFSPFPFDKYDPEKILGAGGFGVAFCCRHRNSGSLVVVKGLRLDNLDRQVQDVFGEARALEELDHPAVIRLRDCDFAGPNQTRPYLVMEYFDGPSLADYVRQTGCLSPENLLAMIRPVAEGLRAAHGRGVLHRDVKPGNLLLRQEGTRWRVKLIDFGLALTPQVIQDTVRTPNRVSSTSTSQSVAGTVDYAAPEQMGQLPGVPLGPYSDVYGFGKTCCFALFGKPRLTPRHFLDLPSRTLASLLEACLEDSPDSRPKNFDEVLKRLSRADDELIPTLREAVEPPVCKATPRSSLATAASVEETPTAIPAEPEPPSKKASRRSSSGVSPGQVKVRLFYSGDWCMVDKTVKVFLDGKLVGAGSTYRGFDLTVDTRVGTHVVELKVLWGGKRLALQLDRPGACEALFFFDRLWGVFSDRIDIVYHS